MLEMLFLSNYPDSHLEKDGMMQRVLAVDEKFRGVSRRYLHISFRKNIRTDEQRLSDGTSIAHYNFWRHFRTISREIRNTKTLYIHSVYNVLPLMLISIVFGGGHIGQKWVLDLHGVVPEEFRMAKKYLLASMFNYVEKWAARHIDLVIMVTHRMNEYFKKKYPTFAGDTLVYNIEPNTLSLTDEVLIDHPDLLVSQSRTVVIYSGNTQVWQNIPLMLETIKNNLSPKLEYIILTGEPTRFNQLLRDHSLENAGIQILSLKPSELKYVYVKANYGFILRDPSPVNIVANPTKLVEYLNFGIVPIVLSNEIGDFKRYNYDYIAVSDFSPDIPKRKSEQNIKVVERMRYENGQIDLKEAVLMSIANLRENSVQNDLHRHRQL